MSKFFRRKSARTNIRGYQCGSPINQDPQHRNMRTNEQPLTLWQENINKAVTIPPLLFQNYTHQITECLGQHSRWGPLLGLYYFKRPSQPFAWMKRISSLQLP